MRQLFVKNLFILETESVKKAKWYIKQRPKQDSVNKRCTVTIGGNNKALCPNLPSFWVFYFRIHPPMLSPTRTHHLTPW